MMKAPRKVGRLRLNARVSVGLTEAVVGQEKELDLRRRPAERAGTRLTEDLRVQVRGAGGAIELARLTYGRVAEPAIAPPAPIGGLLVEVEAAEYQVHHGRGGGTPTVLVQPLRDPAKVLALTATKVNGVVRFQVPPGTAPFRVRLI